MYFRNLLFTRWFVPKIVLTQLMSLKIHITFSIISYHCAGIKINSLCSLSQLLSQIEYIRRMKVTFSDIFGIPRTHTKSTSNI